MKHEFTIEDSQEGEVRNLIDAAVVFTGGKAEIIRELKVVIEDERIAAVLDNLLNHSGNRPASHYPTDKAAKVWTIVETGEMLSQSALSKRLSDKRITEGTALFHEERGNHVVDRKDNGNLTLKRTV